MVVIVMEKALLVMVVVPTGNEASLLVMVVVPTGDAAS